MKKRTFLTVLLSLIATVCCLFGLAACKSDSTVAVTDVTLNVHTLTIAPGQNETLTATVAPNDATDKTVTWSSSNEAVATVSQDGVVTAITLGTADITVTTNDGGKTDTCTVTVYDSDGPVTVEPVHATAVAVNKSVLELTAGETATLSAVFTPENTTNKNVTWSSDNTDVAMVSSAGVVTAYEKGTATVTVTAEDGGFTSTCTVNVKGKQVTGVTLDRETLNLTVGSGSELSATVAPSDADVKTVSWSSSNKAVATVSEQGVVTAISAGNATITVTTTDGSKTATCAVTVSNPTYSIHVKYADGSAVEAGFKLKINDGAELTTDANGNVSAQLAPATYSVVFTAMPVSCLTATYSLTTRIADIAEGVNLVLSADGTGVDRTTARTLTVGEFSLRLADEQTQYYIYTVGNENQQITIIGEDHESTDPEAEKPRITVYDDANYDDGVSDFLNGKDGKYEMTAGHTYYILLSGSSVTEKYSVTVHTHTYELQSLDNIYHGYVPTCTNECGFSGVKDKVAHDYVSGVCTECEHEKVLEPTIGINYYAESGSATEAYLYSSSQSVRNETEIVVPETVTVNDAEMTVVRIGDNGLTVCTAVEVIYLPATIRTISGTAFYRNDNITAGCENLHSLYITDLDAWCAITFGNAGVGRYGSSPFWHSGSGDIYLNYQKLTNANINAPVSAAAFYNVTSLTSVTFGDDVTSIGADAFNGCTNLASIVVGSGVTSIGADAFKGCAQDFKVYYKGTLAEWTALNVTLPAGATVYVYEENENINVTGNYWHYADGNTVKSWHHDYACPAHEHTRATEYSYDNDEHWYVCTFVDPANSEEGACTAQLDKESHTMSYGVCTVCFYDENVGVGTEGLAFELSADGTYAMVSGIGTANLTDGVLTIPKTAVIDDTRYLVSEIKDEAFSRNNDIKEIVINGALKLNYRSFYYCQSLTTVRLNAPVTIGTLQTISSTLSGEPFNLCSKLTEVYAKDFDTWSACNWMYNNSVYCGPCSTASNGSSFITLYVGGTEYKEYVADGAIPAYLFYRVTSLETVDLTNATSVGASAFGSCSGITEVKIDTLDKWFTLATAMKTGSPLASAKNAVLKVGGKEITSFTASDFNNLTVIPNYAFYGVKTLTSVDLTGVTSIGDYAFRSTGLTGEMTLPASVTTIGTYAFANTGLSGNLTIGENVESIGASAFATTSITGVTINAPLTLTAAVFGTALTSVTVNAPVTLSVASPFGTTKITSLYLNAPITAKDTSSNQNMTIFSKCTNLKDVYVDSMTTWFSCVWVGTLMPANNMTYCYVFAGSQNGTLHVKNSQTGEYSALTSFVASDYGITEIPAYAFRYLKKLTYVDLSGVTSIGDNAFQFSGINTVVLTGNVTIGSSVNDSDSDIKIIVKGDAGTVKVGEGYSLSFYKPWNGDYYTGAVYLAEGATGWDSIADFTVTNTETTPTSCFENVYTYSETTQAGCWHYAEDGKTPVLW